jgi:hypothetical protein
MLITFIWKYEKNLLYKFDFLNIYININKITKLYTPKTAFNIPYVTYIKREFKIGYKL